MILWKQGRGGIFELYEMVPGVVLSTLAIWIVSSGSLQIRVLQPQATVAAGNRGQSPIGADPGYSFAITCRTTV